jgi:hypothetical protein
MREDLYWPREELRVAVRVPVMVEITGDRGEVYFLDSVTADVSRSGCRLELGASADLPRWLELGKPFRASLNFGRQTLDAWVAVIWQHGAQCGIQFVDRDKQWLVN